MTPYDPHAVIQIGGRRYDSWSHGQLIESVDVELATNEASEAEVRVFDPDPDYRFINSITQGDGIAEATVQVQLGFGDAAGLSLLFEGILVRVERDQSTTIIRAYDNGFRMRKVQKAEHHNQVTYLSLIEKLARRNGLGYEGPEQPPALERHAIKQEAKTDWALAMECADEAGVVLFVRGSTLYAKTAAKTAPEPLITLRFREDFLLLDDFRFNFKVPENVSSRPAKVEVRGRGRRGRRLTGQSDVSQRGHERVEIKNDLHVRSGKSAAARATARKELQREHAFTGELSVLPAYHGLRVDVRKTVALIGLPKLFNGAWLVDRATHRYAPGELTQQLSLFRDIPGSQQELAETRRRKATARAR